MCLQDFLKQAFCEIVINLISITMTDLSNTAFPCTAGSSSNLPVTSRTKPIGILLVQQILLRLPPSVMARIVSARPRPQVFSH